MATRSSADNKHHPGQFVLTFDHNMYAEDGSVGVDLMTGERVFPATPGEADAAGEKKP